jgi:serine/threonine-protein kinase
VLGDFELIERIGQGAMGTVFKARQRAMDRVVALKVLRPSLAHDEVYVTRFERETRAAARLSHPNIVLAIDAGEQDGSRYFAMEYVEGHTVGLLLTTGPLEESRALAITAQVARALDYAWTRERIVHRDVKPGNIIITADGTAKLADLGLAHDADIGDEESFSKGGRILGTPFYISPEQIRHATDLDVRCDLYGLGATLFHMVTGQPPYAGGDTKAVLARHLHEPPPDPRKVRPEVSPAVARIIARCMATKREDRYPDATALVADVEALLAATSQERPAARVHRVYRRRRPVSPVPILALCLALVAVAVLAIALVGREEPPPPPPKKKRTEVRYPDAERAYGDALAFVEANPRKLTTAIRRFRRVEREHANTPFGRQAAEQRLALEARLDRRATPTLAGLRHRADAYIDRGRYADAIAVFAKFPDELMTDDWRGRVDAEREIVERRARQAFDKALAAAVAKPSIEQRIEALEAMDGPLPAEWQRERDQRIAAAGAERDTLLTRERQKHMAMVLRLFGELRPLYRARAYERAEAAIQAALQSMPEALHPDLKNELRELQALQEVWRVAEKGAAGMVGQPYAVRGIQGALVRVDAGQLTIETPGGTFTEDIHKLTPKQVIEFVRAVLPAREADVAALRLLTAEGDTEGAEALLQKLDGDGEDMSDMRERLRRLSVAPRTEKPPVEKPDEPAPDVPPARPRQKARLRVGCDGTCASRGGCSGPSPDSEAGDAVAARTAARTVERRGRGRVVRVRAHMCHVAGPPHMLSVGIMCVKSKNS